MPTHASLARPRLTALASTSPELRRVTRLACTILDPVRGSMPTMHTDSEPVQRRLAMVAGCVVAACNITGEAPAAVMTRWRITTGWRYPLYRVKGEAGDALRALVSAKKKLTRASRMHPDKIARRTAAVAEMEATLARADDPLDDPLIP